MTWHEVEFLDPQPEPPATPTAEPAPPGAYRARLRALLAPAAWLVAAALATITPFLPVYRISVPQDLPANRTMFHIDGWGRQRPARIAFGGHGIRFGVLLVACAAVLFAAAAWAVWRTMRRRSSESCQPLGWLAVTGTAALAGVMGGYAVYLDADFSTVRAANQQRSDFQSGDSGTIAATLLLRAHLGSGLWLGVAATACAAVGTIAHLSRRTPVPAPEPGASGASAVPDQEDAELDGAELLD